MPLPQATAGKWRDGGSGPPLLAPGAEGAGSEPWGGGTAGLQRSLSAQSIPPLPSLPPLPPLRGGDFADADIRNPHLKFPGGGTEGQGQVREGVALRSLLSGARLPAGLILEG